MKRLNTKKAGLLYGLVLFSYTSYALLDTFVIPHPIKTVLAESANIEATSGIKESIEAKINEKLGLSDYAEASLTEKQTEIVAIVRDKAQAKLKAAREAQEVAPKQVLPPRIVPIPEAAQTLPPSPPWKAVP